MSSSAHSALASLTANYTDSEPEDDVEQDDTTLDKEESKNSGGRSVSPDPIEDSNSRDDANSVSSAGDSTSGGSRSKSNNPLGLVSYQDDLIDDDAVDDFDHNSDSMQDNENPAGDEVDPSTNQEVAAASTKADTVGRDDMGDLEDISQDKESMDETETVQTSVKKVKLPPEPPGKCSQELQDKFAKLLDRKMIKGLNMNTFIQCNKQFRNPSIYEKLIIRCNIDELGTNYPRDIYDPHIWDESSYYDEIAKAQKAEMERREKERKERTKVEFVSGTVKKTMSSSTSAPGAPTEGETKRKSKWDQKGVMPVFATAVSAPTVQPVIVQPPFTTSSSGTKGTVISAFGSLPKKPKN